MMTKIYQKINITYRYWYPKQVDVSWWSIVHICSALGPWILAPEFQAVPCDMLRWPPVTVFQDALKGSEGEAGRVTGEITSSWSFRVWPSSFWGYRIWTAFFQVGRDHPKSQRRVTNPTVIGVWDSIYSMWCGWWAIVCSSQQKSMVIHWDHWPIWLCVAHEKRLVSYKFGTYFSCGNRCGLEIMGCNTDLEWLGDTGV